MERIGIVTGTLGSDCHVTGTRLLEHAFRGAGFRVTGLGAMNPQEAFIKAAVETDASAILVSSLYGHANMDCIGFRQRCEEAGLKGILLYIGGNLAVGDEQVWSRTEKEFRELGFDRVFPPETTPKMAIAALEKDLAATTKRQKGD